MKPAAPWTIFLPIYTTNDTDAKRYLRAAIESACAQSFGAWKLVVVDNKSPIAGLADLVASYNDPRITYHCNDVNRGMAGNWNTCIELCQTTYFTILHSDDLLKPEYAKSMLAIAEKNPEASLYFCGAEIIDDRGDLTWTLLDLVKGFFQPRKDLRLSGEQGLLSLIRGNYLVCPTALYRASKFGEVRFCETDFSLTPDYWMWMKMLLDGHSIYVSPLKLFQYRRHELSNTVEARRGLETLQQERRILKKIALLADELGWREAALQAAKAHFARNRALFFAARDFLNFRFRAAYEKIRFAMQTP